MQITKISAQQKDQNRVNIFIDNTYYFSLTLDQLLTKKLKVGTLVTETDIKLLKKISEDGKLRARALEWAMARPRSRRELKDYLAKKGADDKLAQSIIQEFARKKYQCDEEFTQWWVENRLRKNKSNIAIRAELLQKGIDRELTDKVLGTSSPQKDRLKKLAMQKKTLPKYQTDPIKFKKFLIGKGFSYSDIDDVLGEIADGDEGNF